MSVRDIAKSMTDGTALLLRVVGAVETIAAETIKIREQLAEDIRQASR